LYIHDDARFTANPDHRTGRCRAAIPDRALCHRVGGLENAAVE